VEGESYTAVRTVASDMTRHLKTSGPEYHVFPRSDLDAPGIGGPQSAGRRTWVRITAMRRYRVVRRTIFVAAQPRVRSDHA
jgi:hypothetical protein